MNINFDDKLYNILNGNDKLLQFFINNGFDQLRDKKMLLTMGKIVSLNMAIKVKGINKEAFEEKLKLFLNDGQIKADKTLSEESFQDDKENKDIVIKGIVPCPLRLPLIDSFDKFVEDENRNGLKIGYDLRSASLGVSWLEDEFSNDINNVSDVFLSAGFDLFFNRECIEKFTEKNEYYINMENINKDFEDEKKLFKDPKNIYNIVAVVPCVFLVNYNNLSGKKAPLSWEELLFSGQYTDSVALPLNDLDMFNAVVINIYSKWGIDGIKALAKVYKKSLHPSEMVKKKGDDKYNPIINITPLFFTQMVSRTSALKVVWPKDGAIVSPIFLIAKKNKKGVKKIIDFFTSVEVGEILSSNGKFPTTISGVSNNLDKDSKFLFCGFDFIYNNDIGKLFKSLEKLFNEEILK